MSTLLRFPNLTKHQTWGDLPGCGLSLALAELCSKHSGIKLLITPNNLSAGELLAEIEFFLSSQEQEIILFPDWETLPYDQFSPHQDIISERLRALNRLEQTENAIVVTSISTLMHKLCPPTFLHQHTFMLQEKQKLSLALFRSNLQQAGYYAVTKVLEHGEFAVRGSILDVYPMGSKLPLRIELFDDVIESLRIFDPETQKTLKKIEALRILPAREFPLDEASIRLFRNAFRESFTGNPTQSAIYEAVSDGKLVGGIEYYLPLFFNETATFFDYLPKNTLLCLIDDIAKEAEGFWSEVTSRYEQYQYNIDRPLLPPNKGFLTATEVLTQINLYQKIRFLPVHADRKGTIYNFPIQAVPLLPIKRDIPEPLFNLKEYIHQSAVKVLLIVESAGRREMLLELLQRSALVAESVTDWNHFLESQAPINITIGPLISGIMITESRISIITESQLFGDTPTPQRSRTQKVVDPDLIIRDLAELQLHAPIVHLQFGVGRYKGLTTLESGGISNEFLILAYAGEDRIYVPVTQLYMISRYTGSDSEHAPLHKLGSDQWQKERKKAAEKIHDTAIALLEIYAKREAKPGFRYEYDREAFQQFVSGFPFTETPDQLQAIQQIIVDMQSPRPMDRLICGDVGFGKTEVAMRAAFLAVQNNKQVCILVPTTLLAGQHFENFRDRFANFPIKVELLSRFRSNKESTAIIDAIKNGQVDIIIGTHKLLSNTIEFKNLGLLIIDEEHRFGVKQKEYIKSLRLNVDILSMTATPIPRTLNMALAGIRDISLIATPPAKRLAIKTFWQEKNDALLKEAILREILRGGQVFFLHNNIQTIERIAQELQGLVPDAKVKVAHGQMGERALEKIMSDFYHHRFNVLICTTIIETGIDIPTANTIIIDRADKFGLAQLHQLRGRVGRSHHQAYAYLLTPNEKSLTPDAVKRLEAIVSLEDLGAGFTLASHDMEIRGAGELLGEEQSGNIHAIGFNLYMEMLDKAVTDLKEGKTPELAQPIHQGPEIDLRLSAILPSDYIIDVHTRLIMYKRIANAQDKEQLRQLQIEMIDRFGLMPPAAKNLIIVTELKLKAAQLGINKIQAAQNQGRIEFSANPQINPTAFIELIQIHPKRYKLEGPTRLSFILEKITDIERMEEIMQLLIKLT